MATTIPGSEVFTSRPVDPADLRARISPDLRLHTVGEHEVEALTPLAYEVIRHRLWAITEEMGDAMRRMSGSQAVTEANDFDFAICDELGSPAQVGLYNTGLVGAIDLAISWTLQHRSDNPGIAEGDMFLCNDPWVGGGLHQNDTAVFGPIFYDGQLFGWASAVCHQLDLGGAAPGSWTPTATDVFSESLPTPPVKVVRGGVLQRDIADLWVRRSRLPMLVGLDLRAKIGAVETAARRITALLDKYGPDQVKAVMVRMMDDAEGRLREKLRSLPDGTWSAIGYQEQSHTGDRGVHAIRLSMTKQDDRLIFDFTGTDPQHGMINCPYAGMRGGILHSLLPVLCGDIPWAAGGLVRCMEIISEEGTLNNAEFPAAIGKGPVGPAWVTGNLVAECFAKMLDRVDDAPARVQALCNGTWDLCIMAGVDERSAAGVPYVHLVFDAMAAGFGAQVDRDGVDTGGLSHIPAGRAPDAEMTEFLYPVLTLWRREEIDSGGPGRQRGGLSGSVAFLGHGTTQPRHVVASGAGKAVNQNLGVAGGYPGNSQVDAVFRGGGAARAIAAGRLPTSTPELGERELLQCEGETTILPDDVVFVYWQAGGGYGDPILRDPLAVADDVVNLRVSPEAARDVYGVAVDPGNGAIDEEATSRLRLAIRAERLRRSVGDGASPLGLRGEGRGRDGDRRIDDNAVVRSVDGELGAHCRHCDTMLGAGSSVDASMLARFEGEPAEAGPHIWPSPEAYVDEKVVFRQLSCPGCGVALHSAVVPESQPLPVDHV